MSEVVVVTGGSRGIGLAVTRRMVRDGHRVVCMSRSAPPEEVLAGGSVVHEEVDLADLASVPGHCRRVLSRHGAVYGLVNNAGTGGDGLLATQHQADIARITAVNLTAPMLLTKHIGRSMLRHRRGRIINISSIVARTGFSGLAVYAATKAGLEGFTRSCSREFGRAGITVNAIAPGFISTEMTAGLEADHLRTIARRSPLGLADPVDVADAVAYLMSEGAGRVTGTVLTVDGGATA